MGFNRNLDVSESALRPKFIAFFSAAGESYPSWAADGICNAMALAMLRATASHEKTKHIQRLQSIATMSHEELKRLGSMILRYKSNDKKIEPDKKADLIKARDIYSFLHMLLAMFDPDTQVRLLNTKDEPTLQVDYCEILNLVPSETLKKTPLKEELAFDWNFSKESLAFFIEKYVLEDCHTIIKSPHHTIYVFNEKGTFKIYNSLYGKEVDDGIKEFKNVEDLVKDMIENSFMRDSIVDQTLFPFGIRILKKENSKKEKFDLLSVSNILDELIKKFPDDGVNSQGVENITPLIIASLHGNIEMVKELLKRGALVSMLDDQNEGPATVAAEFGMVEMLKIFNEIGSLPLNGPIRKAAQFGRLNVLTFLSEHKATFDKYDEIMGTNSIMIAAKAGHWDCVAFMLMKTDPEKNKIEAKDYDYLRLHRKQIAKGYEVVGENEIISKTFKETILHRKTLLGKILSTPSFLGGYFSRYKVDGIRVPKTIHALSQKFG